MGHDSRDPAGPSGEPQRVLNPAGYRPAAERAGMHGWIGRNRPNLPYFDAGQRQQYEPLAAFQASTARST